MISLLVLASLLALRVIGTTILALTDESALAGALGNIAPILLWCFSVLILIVNRRWRDCLLTTACGLVLGLVTMSNYGTYQMLRTIWSTRIALAQDYAARCQPNEGVAIAGALIRFCERYDWGEGEVIVVIVQILGKSTILQENQLKFSTSENGAALWKYAPIGVRHYDITHLLGNFYVLRFS